MNKVNQELTLLKLAIGIFAGLCLTFLTQNEVAFFLGVTITIVCTALIAFRVLSMDRQRKNRGIIWIWVVCIFAIAVLALLWLPLSWVSYMMIDVVKENYNFPPQALSAINLLTQVIGYFLVIMLFGLIIWAIVNSQRREDITYPF